MTKTIMQVCETRRVIPPPEVESELNPRIRNLRRLALSFANELDPAERGRAVMDSYDETRTEPMIIRRAKAAAKKKSSAGKNPAAKKKSTARRKTGAKKSAGRKSPAKKKTTARKKAASKK